jgi:hypothetical protein
MPRYRPARVTKLSRHIEIAEKKKPGWRGRETAWLQDFGSANEGEVR